ncbi:hypothetical protein [Streptomyces sp. NPDC048256]|uniref:hypothetical protein n=1 Tax=Streptomyces sp. NPDC048256 TaxID=3154613 RepID=UPI003402221F
MSTRPTKRAPKGRNRDRADRRAVVDVLLARAQRGVLSAAEGALLAEHVREEQRLADENRRAMAGTTQALERHREAADTAIVEAEQHLAEERATFASLAEEHAAVLTRAEVSGATLAEVRRRHRGACDRVDQVLAVLARVRNAQSLGDALAAVAEHDGLSPTAARLHARILDRADSTEARLAEQQREHDVALAVERRRGDGWQRHALAVDHKANRYRTAWFAARRDRRADRAAMAAEVHLAQAVERVRVLAARMRAGSPQGAAAIYADRIEQALAVEPAADDNEHQEQHA